MSGEITATVFRQVLFRASERLQSCSTELNDLDAKLGDGDLGTTLCSVSRALRLELENFPEDFGDFLNGAAQVIAETSGSSFSAVAMIGLRRAAVATKGRKSVPWSELAGLLELGLEAMGDRGGARLGDKSVLDGLAAIAKAVSRESDHRRFADAAGRAIANALVEFRKKPSKIGRARLAGQRSIGLDDPGMVALGHIVEAIRS